MDFVTSMNLRVRATSFEGLVLCSSHVYEHGDYHVCDPITGIQLHLPKPSHRLHDDVHLGLICDPPTSSYIVVCLFSPTKEKGEQTNTIEVETYFSMTDKWRTSTHHSTSPIGFICSDDFGVVLNEALHWIDTSGHVLSYNPTEDSIGLVKLPVAPFRPGYEFLTHSLGVSEESSLFYSTYDYEELAISVWNLEDYSTSTWSLKYKIRETVQIWQCPWNFFTKKQRILIHLIDRGMINYDLENEVSCIMDFRQPIFRGVNYFPFTPSKWPTLVPPSSSQ
ncbi:hypothetical protein QJS04_geneDACA018777 [Acorus gramineus]|uniref:F-box associated domain-containing protein n=1 Tax=Acorus gramineus TaxID=55184 RepID=A0AAV9BKC6_ACOGR|nr:hypothetical protein QJS04_geneDACA018777 [Acorus gramineus]